MPTLVVIKHVRMQYLNSGNTKQLREAREIFSNLLRQKTKENQWQLFFNQYPNVLSNSLPLKLAPNDIIPRGRNGKSEPDYIFYNNYNKIQSTYGVIEIKKPSTNLLTIPRNNIIRLSADAQTAVAQASFYAKEMEGEYIKRDYNTLVLGNQAYVFMIIGLSGEISKKVTNNFLFDQYNNLLPRGFQIIPYDTLYKVFCQTIPPKIFFLLPNMPNDPERVPIVYYNHKGLVKNVQESFVTQYSGMKNEILNGKTIYSINKAGTCLYCGKKYGFDSLSHIKFVPLGKIQNFITDNFDGSPSRLLKCNILSSFEGEDLLFREVYDKGELVKWFQELRNEKKCNRCGSVNDVSIDGFDDYPFMWTSKITCNVCGFYEERHNWGPPSAGA